MKIKNVVMAAIAFTFAIGGAFASMFAPETIYVKARRTANGVVQCIQTNKQCEATGTSPCTISISTSSGTQVANSDGTAGTGSYLVYKVGCVNTLRNNNADPQTVTPQLSVFSMTTDPLP